MEETCAWLESILRRHDDNNRIARVIKVNVEPLESNGDYYASAISFVHLELLLKSGEKSNISLIFKKSFRANRDEDFIGFPIVKKEIKVYKDVLSRFDQLMEEYQDNNDKLWCKFYGYKPYTLMILENAKVDNFKVANRKKLLDFNHTLLVLHSLGRFHALGHVLINRGIINKNDFPLHYMETGLEFVENLFQKGVKQFSRVIQNHWPEEWNEIGLRLSKHLNVTKKLEELYASKENSFQTICHGDCWTCNLLFKYCPYDENIPVAVKFIDFQAVHVNAYIFDIVHFLNVCVQRDLSKNNLDRLLSTYHRSLQATLAIYGMTEGAPSLEQIHADFNSVEYLGFILNMTFLPLTISEVGKGIDLDNINSECGDGEVYNSELFKSEKCQKIVGPDIKYWLEKKIF